MNINLSLFFILIAFSVSCDKEKEPKINSTTQVLKIDKEGNWDYWILSKADSSQMIIDTLNNKLNAIYFKPGINFEGYIILLNSYELPERISYKGFTFIFSNYIKNHFDIAVILQSGEIRIVRNVNSKYTFSNISDDFYKSTNVWISVLNTASMSADIVSSGINFLLDQTEMNLETDEMGFGSKVILCDNEYYDDQFVPLSSDNSVVEYAGALGCGGESLPNCQNAILEHATEMLNNLLLQKKQNPEVIKDAYDDLLKLYPEFGLVAYFPFTGNTQDKSMNGNNGIANGATLTTDRFGNPNNAYLFDGIDDFISVPYDSLLSLTIPFTILLWVYPESYDNTTLLCQSESWDEIYSLYFKKDFIYSGHRGFSPNFFEIPLNTWSYIGFSVNDTITLTLNDEFSFQEIDNGEGIINGKGDNNLFIGKDENGFLPPFRGKMDEIRIYNRALSKKEIFYTYKSRY